MAPPPLSTLSAQPSTISFENYLQQARDAGCSDDQMLRFQRAGLLLQPRQLAAAAAARLCDQPDGPTAVGYGGARGGGKSFWLPRPDGRRRLPARPPASNASSSAKVGKANLEHFEDLRLRVFANLKHEFTATRGILTFANGSRIIAGHFQNERDIDAYLGLEYDVIGIEEATTLSHRKYQDISTCCRSSKLWTPPLASPASILHPQSSLLPPPSDPYRLSPIACHPSPIAPYWRPRIYSTTNPGGAGHAWYRARFIVPFQNRAETATRFIPARVTDNQFNNPEYEQNLRGLTGWQKRAWLDGDWDIAAGQYFPNFRRDIHVLDDFDDTRCREWFAALDYGFTHYTVVLLGAKDSDGNIFVVDEHAERLWLPERHAAAIRNMFIRHGLGNDPAVSPTPFRSINQQPLPDDAPRLCRFVAGTDAFSRQSDGSTVASQYAAFGLNLRPANTDRIQGWAEILRRLGDPDHGLRPKLFIHRRCARLIDTLPILQHDPTRPEDVLKIDADDNGHGGDDAADCLRYLVHTQLPTVVMRKLRGF